MQKSRNTVSEILIGLILIGVGSTPFLRQAVYGGRKATAAASVCRIFIEQQFIINMNIRS